MDGPGAARVGCACATTLCVVEMTPSTGRDGSGSAAFQGRPRTEQHVVIVSGAPGAGKSTLAQPLAHRLGFALLSKDVIKESLFDSIGDFRDDIVATSEALDRAAMSLLWQLAPRCGPVVLEANFKVGTDHEASIRGLRDAPVEVYCRVPPEVARARYDQRGQRPDRHRVHYARTTSTEILAQYQDPLGLGPVIEVDTSRTVDVAALAERVRALLRRE